MHRLAVLSLCWPLLCCAGAYDYYECVGADGSVVFSVERCPNGQRQRRVADDTSPLNRSLGAASGGIVRLESGRGGHFYATVIINGIPARVMVDTGATMVALSPTTARRVGLDIRSGRQMKSQTANGVTAATAIVLDSVELGGNTVRNVAGAVMSQELGTEYEALLGMNFLKHFEVNTDGSVMTLRPR